LERPNTQLSIAGAGAMGNRRGNGARRSAPDIFSRFAAAGAKFRAEIMRRLALKIAAGRGPAAMMRLIR